MKNKVLRWYYESLRYIILKYHHFYTVLFIRPILKKWRIIGDKLFTIEYNHIYRKLIKRSDREDHIYQHFILVTRKMVSLKEHSDEKN